LLTDLPQALQVDDLMNLGAPPAQPAGSAD